MKRKFILLILNYFICQIARLDGEYIDRMSFLFELKCFMGTIISVFKNNGVVEYGTGTLTKAQ